MILDARNLSWRIGEKLIVDDVSFSINKGEFFGLIGPNGSGKTSILSLLAGLQHPTSGEVYLNGEILSRFNRRKIARELAFVQQNNETDAHINAEQVVELGRTPHLSALKPWSQEDTFITKAALNMVDMSSFINRSWNTLSGGEKQRLHFARALAQKTPIMLLDEPTNHLDIHHQLGLLHLVRSQQLTVVAALHDLNHAALFCNRIAMLNEGGLVIIGTPREVLTKERIFEIFHVDADVHIGEDGVPHIQYRRPKSTFPL